MKTSIALLLAKDPRKPPTLLTPETLPSFLQPSNVKASCPCFCSFTSPIKPPTESLPLTAALLTTFFRTTDPLTVMLSAPAEDPVKEQEAPMTRSTTVASLMQQNRPASGNSLPPKTRPSIACPWPRTVPLKALQVPSVEAPNGRARPVSEKSRSWSTSMSSFTVPAVDPAKSEMRSAALLTSRAPATTNKQKGSRTHRRGDETCIAKKAFDRKPTAAIQSRQSRKASLHES